MSHSSTPRSPEYPWGEGTETGPGVAALGVASLLSVAALDLGLAGELSLFFDLCFVALCLALAVVVRTDSFFTVGVLPPLMMLGVLVVVALSSPGAVAHPGDGVVQAVVSGLAHHAGALLAGYAVCLAVLAWRRRAPGR